MNVIISMRDTVLFGRGPVNHRNALAKRMREFRNQTYIRARHQRYDRTTMGPCFALEVLRELSQELWGRE